MAIGTRVVARKPKLGSIYQRGGVLWLKYHRDGKPYRESSGSAQYADAERLLKRRMGEMVSGKFAGLAIERIRMQELFDDLVEEYRLNQRASIVHLRSRLRLHLVPAFGSVRAAELSTTHVKAYTAKRQRAGAANATINRELEAVERALKLATQCDPPKLVRQIHIPMLPENNVRTGFLEDNGYLRLKAELPDYLKPLLVIGYHVGTRLGELLKLRWSAVDFACNQIRLNPGTTKNKKGRTLPIYGHMRQCLITQKAVLDAKYPKCSLVFHHDGQPIVELRKAWASACKRAGCDGLLFHDLRRSAVRNMRLAGLAENVAMQISGHRTRAIFDRYDIVGIRELNEAAAKLEIRLNQSLGTVLGTVAASEPVNAKTLTSEVAGKLLQWKVSTIEGVWLRGKDLNLRPLGYEFNTWFSMDSVIAKNQSHTVSMYLIVSTVSGSPVSNLLALSVCRRHDSIP
jgi:integrase